MKSKYLQALTFTKSHKHLSNFKNKLLQIIDTAVKTYASDTICIQAQSTNFEKKLILSRGGGWNCALIFPFFSI